jgi:hypothetical protein
MKTELKMAIFGLFSMLTLAIVIVSVSFKLLIGLLAISGVAISVGYFLK